MNERLQLHRDYNIGNQIVRLEVGDVEEDLLGAGSLEGVRQEGVHQGAAGAVDDERVRVLARVVEGDVGDQFVHAEVDGCDAAQLVGRPVDRQADGDDD